MIIDRNGKIYSGVYMGCGTIVQDGDFSIFLPYERSEDCVRAEKILSLKRNLAETDYKLMKHMDGALTEEEYNAVRDQRAVWRKQINDLEAEIKMPEISRVEMDEAEKIAMKEVKK